MEARGDLHERPFPPCACAVLKVPKTPLSLQLEDITDSGLSAHSFPPMVRVPERTVFRPRIRSVSPPPAQSRTEVAPGRSGERRVRPRTPRTVPISARSGKPV